MYLKQIEQLVELQKVDNEIVALQADLEAAPKEVEALEERFTGCKERMEQASEKAEMLKDQEKRLTSEIEEDNVRVKKSKSKLMMVGNTREYHAMMREMDNLEKLNRLREEEKMALVEELDRMDQIMSSHQAEFDELSKELEEKRTSLSKRINKAQKQLDDLDKRRSVAGEVVPAPILSRYEFIRSRLDQPVIVSVTEGICSGCNIAIPPQSFIELQKGQQILSCPNCQRLIYWSNHFTDPEIAAKQAEKAAAEAEA